MYEFKVLCCIIIGILAVACAIKYFIDRAKTTSTGGTTKPNGKSFLNRRLLTILLVGVLAMIAMEVYKKHRPAASQVQSQKSSPAVEHSAPQPVIPTFIPIDLQVGVWTDVVYLPKDVGAKFAPLITGGKADIEIDTEHDRFTLLMEPDGKMPIGVTADETGVLIYTDDEGQHSVELVDSVRFKATDPGVKVTRIWKKE